MTRKEGVFWVVQALIVVGVLGLVALPSNSVRVSQVSPSSLPSSSSTLASNGLQLSTSINSTDLAVGQSLNVSISVTNTLATPNGFDGLNGQPDLGPGVPGMPKGETGNWTFYGVPAFTFPQCRTYPWPPPISVLVLSGNYSVERLASIANSSLPFACAGGGIGPAFPFYTFEPKSDVINLTVEYGGGAPLAKPGLFAVSSNFTVTGSWNLSSLAREGPGDYGCIPETPDFPPNYCVLPSSTPFAPGVYTVGVSDEWGQAVVLHFTVTN